MKALLLIAHGSRRQSSNDEIRSLALALKNQHTTEFEIVDCAFLALTTPGISEQIDKLIALGADEVVLLPYFLAAGNHVVKDLPEFVDQAQNKYPNAKFALTKHIGISQEMLPLIMSFASSVTE
jgi:sirohydrochlorin ferrochelatase